MCTNGIVIMLSKIPYLFEILSKMFINKGVWCFLFPSNWRLEKEVGGDTDQTRLSFH